jgi:hypothetical protein
MKNINHQFIQVKQNKPTRKEEKQIHNSLLRKDEATEDIRYVQIIEIGKSRFKISISNQPTQLRGMKIGHNPIYKQLIIAPSVPVRLREKK